MLIHMVFLLALPIIVAWYGFSTLTAVLLVLGVLLWRVLITLSTLLYPRKVPELELETISASHFVEKVRWCMDRLGVEYTERQMAGILGVIFKGRTVPQLRIRTGLVISVIGDSPDILRYLWGRYSGQLGDKAAFLEPSQARLEWESRTDHYGRQLQVWLYSHLLAHRKLTLHGWGSNSKRIPLWQRWTVIALYPVLAAFIRKAFRLTPGHFEKATRNIEKILQDVEERLESGQNTILGGETIDYVDISFAAMTGLWLQPRGYGGGKADEVMLSRDQLPAEMRADVERWIAAYPATERYVQRMFREERVHHSRDGDVAPTDPG
jgi:glutathione S-transferase